MSLFLLLSRLLLDLPGEPPRYVKPPNTTAPRYFEFLEDNAHILYPLLAVAVLIIIAVGVLQAWRTDDLSGVQKAEIKREVIRELRRDVHGITVERLAKAVAVPPLRLLKLLEEMQEDGVAESRTDTARVTTWRLKGLGG